MLLVKTKIGPSKIHGIGLFASQFIPKGTVVWQFEEGFDIKFSIAKLMILPPPAKEIVLNFAYLNKDGDYVLCSDDARFFNHSNQANVTSPEDDNEPNLAARDIQPGEELTQDYKSFDADFEHKITKDK